MSKNFKPSDFDDIVKISVENADNVKIVKRSKPKKGSKSIKQLKFDLKDDDSAIKAAIVQQINAKDLTYDDLKEYCYKLTGNQDEGIRLCYNIISGLRYRTSMMDKTVSILMDFLNVDMLLVPRFDDEIYASTASLIQKLKLHPDRLDDVLNLIQTAVMDDEDPAEAIEEEE